MGNVITRLGYPTNISTDDDTTKSEWDDSQNFASTLHAPITQPSEAIIEATEKGMIGENCLAMLQQTEGPDWPMQSQNTSASTSTSTDTSVSESGASGESTRGGETACLDCVEEREGSDGRSLEHLEEGGSRVWNGFDETGCRHVTWKGLNA